MYSKIPQFKLNKKFLSEVDYKSISKETDIKIDEVKLIDKFVNTKTESGDEEVNNQENDKELIKTLNDNKLFVGGPVLTDRILFLHSLKKIPKSIIVNKEVSVSSDLNVLNLVSNSSDQEYKLFLGHSGWSQGQLEREIENGDWLLQKSINSLIFEKSTDHIWHIAVNSLGIEINDIMNHPGKS